MKRHLLALMLALLPLLAAAQSYNQMTPDGNVTEGGRPSGNFNPHNNDTTRAKETPRGIYAWTVDQRFGDITRVAVDTVPHLFPQSMMAMGTTGDFQTVGSNFTARQSRIFTDRTPASQFLFVDTYDQVLRQPGQWHFTNTLSPITNLTYGSCGDKTDGEDLIDARFAVNAGKRTGMGFDLDYRYARGYYQNQNNSHFGATFYVSHLGDRYQLHALVQTHHQKAAEHGGITSDDYITHPELFSESYSDNEIPTQLASNWNRNDHQRLFLTHRYALGFYRKVPMTEEEKRARQFAVEAEKERAAKEQQENAAEEPAGRPADAQVAGDAPAPAPADSTLAAEGRISVSSKAQADSLIAAADAADAEEDFMKREFVPVTSFIHTLDVARHDRTYLAYRTPTGYYADTLYSTTLGRGYSADSIYDNTRFLNLRNTFAVALLEGFNKYAPAGLKAFVGYDMRRYDMPDVAATDTASMHRWTEHSVSLGGQLVKAQGSLLHYNATVEAWVAGEDAGDLKLDAHADLNFKLLGDTVRLDAMAYMHRTNPVFLQRRYHAKHFWWDNDLDKQTRTHVEGSLVSDRTRTRLRVAVDNIQNYTYLGVSYAFSGENLQGLTAGYRQHGEALNVLTAQLEQRLSLGPLNWDNVLTYQTTSDDDVLPVPQFNVFSNLYLKFMVAHVLSIEMGASATWFSKYCAPDFVPQLNQYAVQQNADTRQELGNFPYVDVYANLHLKHARFFVMMNNALARNFDRRVFLTPHYPLNRAVLYMGVSWNFFN